MTIADFNDIHSHTPGEGRVLSVDITDPGDMARLVDGQYFTVGVHPWHANAEVDWTLFMKLLASPYCVGIGECGLDRRRGPAMEVQERVLRRQLDVAAVAHVPVVLHIVGALDRLLALRKEYGCNELWIVHGFRGKVAAARQLADAGIGISLGGRYNPDVPDAVDRALIYRETD